MKPADDLDALAKLLSTRQLTAKQIAAELGCCLPTAYQRIARLKDRGDNVIEIKARRKKPGPAPTVYAIQAA